MSGKPERVGDYLEHIRDAISRIDRYVLGLDRTDFMNNDMIQDAVIRNLEIIGEACRNIERADPVFASAHPELPLSAAYEMRNVLSHGYFQVDMDIVWKTLGHDIPALRSVIDTLLSQQR